MDRSHPLIALGHFGRSQRAELAEAAARSAFAFHAAHSVDEATAWLDKHQPYAMLVDTTTIDPEPIAIKARAEARHAQIPVLALSKDVSDLSFARAFSWGADDVVQADSRWSLISRLRSLPREAAEIPDAARGTALVAEPDTVRRILLGRVLRNAGYGIVFAVDAAEIAKFAATSQLALIVANVELCGEEPRSVVEATGSTGTTWVFSCPPRQLRERAQQLEGLRNACVTDGFAPPENIIFLANELGRGNSPDQRQSPRLLYGTTIAFRAAGASEDEYGYTYNISEGGIYVRTLVPPEAGEVWLELTPPRSERRVRLVGAIRWRRRIGPNASATVPPGFGLELADGAKADIAAWKDGYAAIRGELL